MNNSEYIRENLTDEIIAEHIYKLHCENSDCVNCPLGNSCKKIYELLESKNKSEPMPKDVILWWLAYSQDCVFYSGNISLKEDKMKSPHWRACGMCRRLSTEVSIASVYINSASAPKVITYICEDCYEKFRKMMNVPEHKHLEPSFTLKKALPKKRKNKQNFTICHQCETRCSPKHFYCHECGELLDR